MLKEISYLAVANETPAKSPIKAVGVSALSPTKSPRKSPISNIASPNNEQENKENSDFQIHMRSKLHRLGKLYSGKQYLKIRC